MLKPLFFLTLLLETLCLGAGPGRDRGVLALEFCPEHQRAISGGHPQRDSLQWLSATVNKLSIDTKQTIQAIGLATTNTFSSEAQLVGVERIYIITPT